MILGFHQSEKFTLKLTQSVQLLSGSFEMKSDLTVNVERQDTIFRVDSDTPRSQMN